MMGLGVLDSIIALCARALLDTIWLGLLCTLAVTIVLRAVTTISAATRYTTWCLVLVTLFCLPPATLAGSFLHMSAAAAAHGGSTAAEPLGELAPKNDHIASPNSAPAAPRVHAWWNFAEATDSQGSWPLVARAVTPAFSYAVVLAWVFVALVRFLRLIATLGRLRSLKHTAAYVEPQVALPRNAGLLCSDASAMPCALGYFHPAILVSPRFVADLAEFDRHQILVHEAAHLRRHDDFTTLLYHVACCLLWFNPAVYVIGRAMSVDREIACDDLVVAATGEPRRYAQTLWNIAQAAIAPTLPLTSPIFRSRSRAMVRLERLLGPRLAERQRHSRLVQASGVVLGCSALVAGAYLAPARAWPLPVSIAQVAPMQEMRADHTATLLRDGKILLAGGLAGNTPDTALKAAELYDPTHRTFARTGDMHVARGGASATLLRDGTVLIAGGWTSSGITPQSELYDPRTGTFARTGSLQVARADHTATMLCDGRVLVSGGAVGDLSATASAEIYDSGTHTFTPTGSMHVPRTEHAATLLNDGRVLVVGGDNAGATLAGAEIFDPAARGFRVTGSMSSPRTKLGAVRLPDGKVLVMGGQLDLPRGERESGSELFDPTTEQFEGSGSMHEARFKITNAAVLVANGNVLVAGGGDRAELYTEATRSFSVIPGSLGLARHFATATVLKDGSVLVAGGYSLPNPHTTASAVVLTL